MKKTNPLYQDQLDHVVNVLMKEFSQWNDIQKELKDRGYEHNYYDDEEVKREERAFRAIAERLLLEDIDYESWKWFETSWAGIDGNTGMEARIIDFVVSDSKGGMSGIVGFYAARNRRYWFAVPLAEVVDEKKHLDIFEVNCVHDALSGWLTSHST